MCIINHSALGQLNWLMTAIASSRTSQRGEAPTSSKRQNQMGGNALWQSVLTVATELALRHVLWTLDGLRNTIFNSAVGKQQKASRHSVFSVNSHKASPLRSVSGLAVVIPSQCLMVSKLYYLQLQHSNWLLLQVTE